MSATAVLSGGLFGAALLYSGVSSPATIRAQLALEDMHMLQAFLVASAVTALLTLLHPLPARTPSPLSRLFPYSANLAGGLLQGIGMVLAGACPGTGLVQLGAGVPSGPYFLAGGLLGALVYVALAPVLQPRPGAALPAAKSTGATTIPGLLGVGRVPVVLAWGVLCGAAVLGLDSSGGGGGGGWGGFYKAQPGAAWRAPVVGGLALGAAQAASVLLRGSLVGVSGGYAQAVEWALAALQGKRNRPPLGAAQFSAAVVAGAWLLARLVPEMLSQVGGGGVVVTKGAAVGGGMLQILGARLAGGCTSGHGLSGLATLGVASFVTVAGTFGGGIAFTLAYY